MPIDAIVFDAYGTLYDVQSVSHVAVAVAPDQGVLLTQLWRLKQLEYSWLHGLIGSRPGFAAITREALLYSAQAIGLGLREAEIKTLCDAYERLMAFDDTRPALDALRERRLVILSNGDQAMLDALVEGSGLSGLFEAVISVEASGAFKPSPQAYELVGRRLALPPDRVLFVSSNGFDVAGAKAAGFVVARIARSSGAGDLSHHPGPTELFQALRAREERLGLPADHTLSSLEDVPKLLARLA